jgi:CRISPR type III-A-associated RAMP protein Csm5
LICYLYSGEEKGLKNKKNYIGEDILGKYSDDVLKHLMISDTQPFQEDALGIERFNRFNLENKKVTIPVVKEVIKEGSITHFRIKSKAGSSDLKGKFSFLQEGNEEELLSIINKYAKRNITIELDQLDKYSGEEINKLKDFYKRLLHDVKNVDEKKAAYLRIGSGKTYYNNTIAQCLSKGFLKQIIDKNFKNSNIENFPTTRTVIFKGSFIYVPGWIKITRE